MRKRFTFIVMSMIAALLVAIPMTGFAANPVMTVNVGSSTGAPLHGATGFLYGLKDGSTPGDSLLTGLNNLDMTGQMAPGGTQHAGGDAFVVADQWFSNGGKYIQIYMQDYYTGFPYPNVGISSYLNVVSTIANQVKNHPNRTQFLYVPFNEPDWIWYGTSGTKLNNFKNDWKTVYQKIRSIDPGAKIVGPNFEHYNSTAYRDFYTFAKANNVLPAYTSWHELDDTTSTYYNSYNDYRDIENDLGISDIPISINEYAKVGELGVPGKMVQYITRFENTKVHAGLAYWYPEGRLDELLTPSYTKAGAWYLYQWYGGFTGNTISVTPPSQNGAMQGLGYYDSSRSISAVIFGGGSGSLDIHLQGIPSNLQNNGVSKVELWGVDNSNKSTSSGTYLISSTNYTVSNGSVEFTVNNLNANSAYQLVILPGTGSGTGGGTSGGSFDPNAYYKIINRTNGMGLDSGGNVAQGSIVKQWNYVNSSNLQWHVVDVGGGYYKIVNRTNGMVIDSGGNVPQGTSAIQWSANGNSNQQWQIVDVGGGYYRIMNRTNGMALDSGGNVAQGSAAKQWNWDGSTNLQWQIIEVQ